MDVSSQQERVSTVPKNIASSVEQAHGKATLYERTVDMLFSECMSDVCFLVGNPAERIHAHSYVLAVGSSVFYTMLYGSFPRSAEIAITDIEPEPFRILLKYLYTDKVDLNADCALSVLYAAKKYSVGHLFDACVDFWNKSLDADNVCSLLSQSVMFDEGKLTEGCLAFIDNCADIVLQSEGFLKLSRDNLNLIVSRDSLTLRDEMVVYDAVMKWAEDELCRKKLEQPFLDKRSAIGDAFFQIRFPTLKAEEFANGPAIQTDLFSEEEIAEVLMKQLSGRPLKKFISNKRNFVQMQTYIRFTSKGNAQLFRQYDCFYVQFSVSQSIFIAGYGIFSCSSPTGVDKNVRITIKLFNVSHNREVLASTSKMLSSDTSGNIIPVYFGKRVKIERGIWYAASLAFDSDAFSFINPNFVYPQLNLFGQQPSIFGQQPSIFGQQPITANACTFSFQQHSSNLLAAPYRDMGNGQIPHILFCT